MFKKYQVVLVIMLMILTMCMILKAYAITFNCFPALFLGTFSNPYVKWGASTTSDELMVESDLHPKLFIDGVLYKEVYVIRYSTYSAVVELSESGIYEPGCGSVYSVSSYHKFRFVNQDTFSYVWTEPIYKIAN